MTGTVFTQNHSTNPTNQSIPTFTKRDLKVVGKVEQAAVSSRQ
jgi:hypothetical protein